MPLAVSTAPVVRVAIVMVCALVALTGCRTARPSGAGHQRGLPEEGLASFYSDSLQGRPTASGEHYDRRLFTAAHRTLGMGTCVTVTNLGNGRSVRVRINDRGPFVTGRVIDVSWAAASALGMVEQGVARVRLTACCLKERGAC